MDMRVEFLFRGGHADAPEAWRDYAKRRLAFTARRFGHRIRQLTVRLVDQNGPRRGVDARCSLSADLVDGRRLFVEAIAAWPFAAITAAAARLNEVLRRDGERYALDPGRPRPPRAARVAAR